VDVTPWFGRIAGNDAITITGVNLTGATSIKIGGVPATGLTVVDDRTVTARTPGSPGGGQERTRCRSQLQVARQPRPTGSHTLFEGCAEQIHWTFTRITPPHQPLSNPWRSGSLTIMAS
jgi:hypothetical protein